MEEEHFLSGLKIKDKIKDKVKLKFEHKTRFIKTF